MSRADAALTQSVIRLDHLCCGKEALLARELLAPYSEISDVKISLTDRRASIEHRTSLPASEIVRVLNSGHLGASVSEANSSRAGSGWRAYDFLRAASTTLLVVLYGIALIFHNIGNGSRAIQPAWGSVLLSWQLFYAAYHAVLRRSPNVELLMAIAAAGSVALGEIVDAASVGAIVAVMDVVKLIAIERFARQLRGAAGAPPTVGVVGGGSIAVSAIRPGTVFAVRAGDAIPADGRVSAGRASVDESRLTGEALPQPKELGDDVSGGSVVASGYLEVEAERPADESFQARVAGLVREAEGTLSEAEAQVARFARYYTPAVVTVAAVLGCFQGFRQFLVVLVAGCPCALLGAAPFAHGAALAALAARHRLLLKRTGALEALAKIKAVGLDKTGTLTKGQFELISLTPTVARGRLEPWPRESLHRWVAAVEVRDAHPIARSLVQSYTGCAVNFAGGDGLPDVDGFKRVGRNGVYARVEGRTVGVGNAEFVAETIGDASAAPAADVATGTYAGGGRTVLYATVDGAVAAVLVLEDALRSDAWSTVDQLKCLGVRPIMLTGDRHENAARVADLVGIAAADVHAALLPAEKARLVLECSALGEIFSDVEGERWARQGESINAQLIASSSSFVRRMMTRMNERVDLIRASPSFKALRMPLLDGADRERTESDAAAAAAEAAAAIEDGGGSNGSNGGSNGNGNHNGGNHNGGGASMARDNKKNLVGFVGDGLNDCAALASAHVGIVLQEVGSQATVDAASAVLQGELSQLPLAILLARRAMDLVKANVVLALAFNGAVVLCAATVGLPLWASVAADNAGLLLVLCNSLWPLCWTIAPPERAPEDVAAARAQEPVVERGNKPPTPTFFGLRPPTPSKYLPGGGPPAAAPPPSAPPPSAPPPSSFPASPPAPADLQLSADPASPPIPYGSPSTLPPWPAGYVGPGPQG